MLFRSEALALSGNAVKSQKIKVNFENFGNVSRNSDKAIFGQREKAFFTVGRFEKISDC